MNKQSNVNIAEALHILQESVVVVVSVDVHVDVVVVEGDVIVAPVVVVVMQVSPSKPSKYELSPLMLLLTRSRLVLTLYKAVEKADENV